MSTPPSADVPRETQVAALHAHVASLQSENTELRRACAQARGESPPWMLEFARKRSEKLAKQAAELFGMSYKTQLLALDITPAEIRRKIGRRRSGGIYKKLGQLVGIRY